LAPCEKKTQKQKEMEQSVNGGSGGRHNNDATMCEPTTVIPWKTLNELKMSVIQNEAENKYLQDRLRLEEEQKRLRETNKDIESKLAVAAVQVQNAEGLVVFEKERADRAEAAAKEQMEREKAHADKIEAMAKEKTALAEAAAKERFEREKLQQETVFLQEKAALELKVKEMELANLRLQLEQDKGKNKRGSEENAGGSAGPRRRSAAADASLSDSSSQVVLMPYSDSLTKKDFASNRQSRRFRWLMVYSAPRALEVLDFGEGMKYVTTMALDDGEWMSLLYFKEKYRFSPEPHFVKNFRASGRITGRVLFEAQWDVTHRFLVSAVQSDELRRALLTSPSLVNENGATYYKMHLVVE
jgi:hypothetical protein